LLPVGRGRAAVLSCHLAHKPTNSYVVIQEPEHNLFDRRPLASGSVLPPDNALGSVHGLYLLRSEAFVTTETELNAIAPAAIIGLRSV
jgi:hypothetical protein